MDRCEFQLTPTHELNKKIYENNTTHILNHSLCINPFIHSFNKYLHNVYSIPDVKLRDKHKVGNKEIWLHEGYSLLLGRTDIKNHTDQ